jgi:Domain of unknown function (DUF4174)
MKTNLRIPSIAVGIAAGLAFLLPVSAALAQKGEHEEHRPRLLLVFAPDENNKALIDQYGRLQRDGNEVDAEDVDIIYVIGDHMVKLPPPDMKTVSGNDLRKLYHVDAGGFRVVLVGDNGWEKKRWSEPTDPHAILTHAAEMPKPKSALDDKK